jgi:DNA-binding CsgD family transcriptional regulator
MTVPLSLREQQLLQHLAAGVSLTAAAVGMGIAEETAKSYLHVAKGKLSRRTTPALVHAAYLAGSLPLPDHIDDAPDIGWDRLALLQHIITGKSASQIAADTRRPVAIVRRDVRLLLVDLRAENTAHAVTRAWALGLLNSSVQRAAG